MAKTNQQIVTPLTTMPFTYPMWNTPGYIVLRRSMKFVSVGTRHAKLLIVTADPRSELKAVDEPRYKHPSAATMAVTHSWALKGIFSVVLTFDQVLEKGIASSRENAQKTRPVLSWEPTMHGPRAIQSMNVKANAPPTVVVAW